MKHNPLLLLWLVHILTTSSTFNNYIFEKKHMIICLENQLLTLTIQFSDIPGQDHSLQEFFYTPKCMYNNKKFKVCF